MWSIYSVAPRVFPFCLPSIKNRCHFHSRKTIIYHFLENSHEWQLLAAKFSKHWEIFFSFSQNFLSYIHACVHHMFVLLAIVACCYIEIRTDVVPHCPVNFPFLILHTAQGRQRKNKGKLQRQWQGKRKEKKIRIWARMLEKLDYIQWLAWMFMNFPSLFL